MGDVDAKLVQPSESDGPKSKSISTGSTLMENPAPGNSPPEAVGRGQRPPPVDHGDLDMRIARDGTWFYRGSPIARQRLVKLFASVLRREDDGSYWLVTPVERGRVSVEDAPFLAVELNIYTHGLLYAISVVRSREM